MIVFKVNLRVTWRDRTISPQETSWEVEAYTEDQAVMAATARLMEIRPVRIIGVTSVELIGMPAAGLNR